METRLKKLNLTQKILRAIFLKPKRSLIIFALIVAATTGVYHMFGVKTSDPSAETLVKTEEKAARELAYENS